MSRAAGSGPAAEATGGTILLGTVSRDRYLASGEELPGGGILNVAWHWRRASRPFTLLTRLGDVDAAPALGFLARHGIPHLPDAIVAPGRSSSIDIEIRSDRQPWMDRFEPGVWAAFELGPAELAVLRSARRLHAVLIEDVVRELGRLGDRGLLGQAEVAADFLGFRHYTVDRFADTMRHVHLGFVGWPGDPDDPAVGGLREVAHDLGRLVVVTMGARSVRVFDGRPDGGPDFDVRVTPVRVTGTTLGCGDAFIAGFLDEFWHHRDARAAVERGNQEGAAATAWVGPLPDGAYASPPRLRPA